MAKAITITTRELGPSKTEDRRIRVMGGGLTTTVIYDLDETHARNHGHAASVIARRLGLQPTDPASFEEVYKGKGVRFTFPRGSKS